MSTSPGHQAMLVHYPVNSEAPFVFDNISGVNFKTYSENSASDIGLEIKSFKADIILCSGWGNKQYLQWVREHPSNVKKVICFDNQWLGKPKQVFLSLISRFTFLKMFRYAWVPGEPQKKYALKLGFKESKVFTGLYPADSHIFMDIGKQKLKSRNQPFPKKFISVARYIPQKDLPTLWNAFIESKRKTNSQWVLDCYGFGEGFDQRVQHEAIFHHGFRQPDEMKDILLNAGVYVLPSLYEPWGVAVHEMALSALPLVLSDKVGAASLFLGPLNGFSFAAGKQEELTNVLEKIMKMSDEELWRMAEMSYQSGQQLNSQHWSDVLLRIDQDQP